MRHDYPELAAIDYYPTPPPVYSWSPPPTPPRPTLYYRGRRVSGALALALAVRAHLLRKSATRPVVKTTTPR